MPRRVNAASAREAVSRVVWTLTASDAITGAGAIAFTLLSWLLLWHWPSA